MIGTAGRVGIGVEIDGIVSLCLYFDLHTVGQMVIRLYGYAAAQVPMICMKIFYGMGSGLRQNLDYNSDLKRMPVVCPASRRTSRHCPLP